MTLRQERPIDVSLEELLGDLPHRWVKGSDVRGVTGVTHDSRRAVPGAVFVAMRGNRSDGLDHAADAVAGGAIAVVMGRREAGARLPAGTGRVVEVDDERTALAVIAREFHGRVDERIAVVGVTGTNGKTTTCRVLASVIEASGTRTGVIGTVSHHVGDAEIEADLTTPEAPDIHEYMARMESAGCGACVMEVSSVALDRRRVHGIRFAAAVFTNLTQDHLDYHGDMERYFRAKAMLFESLGESSAAVVNWDDPWGRRLEGKAPNLIRFGRSAGSDVRLVDLETGETGSRLTIETPEGGRTLETSLVGEPNAANVLGAAAAARALGLGWEAIEGGIRGAAAVPGRLEPVAAEGRSVPFRVYVDYAHTDDALRRLLETVRGVTPGRVILVFGCGGDRDRTKRPLMGGHAENLADLVWVTSDNPRTEDPRRIIDEILAGISPAAVAEGRVRAEIDRRKAIEAAIGAACAGDAVVIAGKGHETHQISGGNVTRFDDREVARESLELLG